jgi:LysW-gamma-L-lysine carboxypeptidase
LDEVAFLRSLLAIPSSTGEVDALAQYLVEQMSARGFRAHQDEVGNVVGVLGNAAAEREIVLLGHMDTVPGFIQVREEGGRLYGRGAVDAKGPLAAFVLAAAELAQQLHDICLVVIGTVDEEGDAQGARHLAQTRQAPDCAIIGEPSGWEGITLGYKGVLSLTYRLERPGGHSAGQQSGPAEEAVGFWNKLAEYAQDHNVGRERRFLTLDPALRSLNTSGDGLVERATMQVAARLPPGLEVEELKAEMETWRGDAALVFAPSDPPFQAAKNTRLVRALLRGIRANGGRPRFKLKTGTCDMNVVGPAWRCPMLAYGPGDSALDHTPQEHLEVKEFLSGVSVLRHALETLVARGQ